MIASEEGGGACQGEKGRNGTIVSATANLCLPAKFEGGLLSCLRSSSRPRAMRGSVQCLLQQLANKHVRALNTFSLLCARCVVGGWCIGVTHAIIDHRRHRACINEELAGTKASLALFRKNRNVDRVYHKYTRAWFIFMSMTPRSCTCVGRSS